LPRPHRQIDINPAEFAKYKLDKPIVDIGGISGMLWIHLLAGRGLRTAPEGAGGQAPPGQTRDLYCVIECDRVHKARTVVRSGDLQFDWDESFELDLVGNKQLDVLVYSWDPQHRHKLCYRGAISLSSILRQSPPRAQRFSCSAENIHDALRNVSINFSNKYPILFHDDIIFPKDGEHLLE